MRMLHKAALLAALVLAAVPTGVFGQCDTPEGCKNIEGYQACVEPEQAQTPCEWEDCYVDQGFCQLSDCCDEECCEGGGIHEDQLATNVFHPDLAITPAGTYLPPARMRIPESTAETVRSCQGLVVSAGEDPETRPRTITLE